MRETVLVGTPRLYIRTKRETEPLLQSYKIIMPKHHCCMRRKNDHADLAEKEWHSPLMSSTPPGLHGAHKSKFKTVNFGGVHRISGFDDSQGLSKVGCSGHKARGWRETRLVGGDIYLLILAVRAHVIDK